MSQTRDMAKALHSAMKPESLAQKCRRHMNDPNIPPEIRNTLFDAAKALDWQKLVLTGLSQSEKDVVGALSHTIACQQEEIRKLEAREHDLNMQQQMDKMKQQQQMEVEMNKYVRQASAPLPSTSQTYGGIAPRQVGTSTFDPKEMDKLIQDALKFKG